MNKEFLFYSLKNLESEKNIIYEEANAFKIKIIAYKVFNESNYEDLIDFFSYIEETYKKNISITKVSLGCTVIEFQVEIHNISDKIDFIKRCLVDEELFDKAQKNSIVRFIICQPLEGINTQTRRRDGYNEQFINTINISGGSTVFNFKDIALNKNVNNFLNESPTREDFEYLINDLQKLASIYDIFDHKEDKEVINETIKQAENKDWQSVKEKLKNFSRECLDITKNIGTSVLAGLLISLLL